MERFVVRFTGGGAAPPEQASMIKRRCKVIDESSRMLLIEAEPADVEQLLADLPGWKSSKEVHYTSPEPPLSVAKQQQVK
jgi:hypothetical protein